SSRKEKVLRALSDHDNNDSAGALTRPVRLQPFICLFKTVREKNGGGSQPLSIRVLACSASKDCARGTNSPVWRVVSPFSGLSLVRPRKATIEWHCPLRECSSW